MFIERKLSRSDSMPNRKHNHIYFMNRTFLSAIFICLISVSLFGNIEISDIYYKDYELINRTVIVLSDLPNFEVQELVRDRKIVLVLEKTNKSSKVPNFYETADSPIIENIVPRQYANGKMEITITTRQPYYLEYFYLPSEPGKLVLDIFNKKEPTTIEEMEIYASFFQIVGFNNRAKDLINKINTQLVDGEKKTELTSTKTVNEQPINPTPTSTATEEENNNFISLSKDTSFNDVMKIFAAIIRQNENKILINKTDIDEPLGFDIDKLYWKAAFNSIIRNKNITLTEDDDYYMLEKEKEKETPQERAKTEQHLDNVLIEVTFFEADFNAITELGIDWSTLVDGKVRIGAGMGSTDQLSQKLLTVRGEHDLTYKGSTIEINALFDTFSANNKGHIISRPQITVLSGETGNVQDGMDYTILVPGKTTDGSDTASEVSVQSGTIVNVTPVVMLDNENEKVVHLTIKVERSSVQPDATGFSKKTADVVSKKILYNGEETVIGGLIANEKIEVRKGIPFLKDLPWWVLGIRFLTGHNRFENYTKELVILIKATILPSVEERRKIGKDVQEDIDHQRKQLEETIPKLIGDKKDSKKKKKK